MTTESRRYHIRETLGKGGFGTVYRADLFASGDFAKPVALKVLRQDIDDLEDVTRRLRDEARMLGLLRHRAIVQVDGLVMLNGRWAIVMEYVEGISIRDVLRQHPIPLGAALEVTAEVAGALHVAYARPTRSGEPLKLLHRDIKPANIQLTPNGEVKVLDFGVARAEFDTREAETQAIMLGTFPYMSPERLDMIDTHAGDMYALGVLLYEMVVGAPFGKTSSNVEKHQKKIDQALADIRRITQAPEVLQLLTDALAYEIDDRPTAEIFERRARDLRKRVTGPWLTDWASKVVPELLAHRPMVEDELSGVTLIEQTDASFRSEIVSVATAVGNTESGTTTESGAFPQRKSTLALAMLLGLGPVLGGVIFGALVLVAVLLYRWMPISAPPIAAPVPADTDAIANVAPPPPAAPPSTPDTPKTSLPPTSKPVPATKPAPVTRPTPPPAAPAPITDAVIVVNGEASSVVLVGGGKAYTPGPVPAGTYTVQATFPGTGSVEAGRVTVASGGTIEISCKAAFQRCR